MIQRVQTLFLLAATGLLTGMFFSPMVTYIDQTVCYRSSWILLFFLILCGAVGFITIFLYHHRMTQIRLCLFNSLVLLGLQGIIIYYVITAEPGGVFSLTVAFPLIAAILLVLAIRYIGRDEAMIRSLNRLR
jgi:peptidoglycan/LPS O-acetylase OafA/YrhL